MRKQLPAVLTIAFLASFTIADDSTDALKVVNKAIEVTGGHKQLSGLTGGVWKTSGTVKGKVSRADFSGELPGKFRIDSYRKVEGKSVRFSRIINGTKGWVVEGDKIRAMSKDEINGVKSTFYHKQTATTLIGLRDREVKLSIAGHKTRDNRAVTQIRAKRSGYPDLLLTFDDQSGLLVQSEMTDKDSRTGTHRKVTIEFSNHRTFDGIKMAARTRTFHTDILFLDVELIEFRRAKNLPEKLFTPEGK